MPKIPIDIRRTDFEDRPALDRYISKFDPADRLDRELVMTPEQAGKYFLDQNCKIYDVTVRIENNEEKTREKERPVGRGASRSRRRGYG